MLGEWEKLLKVFCWLLVGILWVCPNDDAQPILRKPIEERHGRQAGRWDRERDLPTLVSEWGVCWLVVYRTGFDGIC